MEISAYEVKKSKKNSNFIKNKKILRVKKKHIKDFPDALHRQAKSKAVLEGISLKGLIINALKEYLERKGGN